MIKFFKSFAGNRDGISSVEYALLLAFVAAGIIVAADALSNAVSNEMTQAAGCISGDSGQSGC